MKKLIAIVVLAVPVFAGCTTVPVPGFDGQPWTSTHHEPWCQRQGPSVITPGWLRRHPNSPCATGNS